MVTKRFNTYIGREMLARLLHFPYMTDREFRALPPTPTAAASTAVCKTISSSTVFSA